MKIEIPGEYILFWQIVSFLLEYGPLKIEIGSDLQKYSRIDKNVDLINIEHFAW